MSLVGCGLEQKAPGFWFRVMFTLKISYVGLSGMTQSLDFNQELCERIAPVDVKCRGLKLR